MIERELKRFGVPAILLLGLALRLKQAGASYLNPDEIQYFFLALPGNFKALWLSSLATDHPPLLFFLVHPFAAVTSSELALRLIPVLAGTLFPWVVYRWLSASWNAGAGFIVLCILTLSPNLISLSAELRGYSLELLFAAVALLFLDAAIRSRSARAMIVFDLALSLAILTEYSAALFAAAVGIYFLMRAYTRELPLRLLGVWAAGQLGGLALLATLLETSIRPRLGRHQQFVEGYLRGGFPAPNQNPLIFAPLGTAKQFSYVFSSYAVGIGAALLFMACLVILWNGATLANQARDRIFAALLVMPFVLFYAGSLLHLQPYGRSRHSVLLAIFAATGASVAFERILRARPWLAGAAALATVLVWLLVPTLDSQTIPQSQSRKQSMAEAIRFIQASIPPGGLVLANQQTARDLRFYWSRQEELRSVIDYDSEDGPPVGSLRVIYRHWDFSEVDKFLEDLAVARSELGLSKDAPIWVVDGGFYSRIDLGLRARFPGIVLPGFHDFGGAIEVFRAPPVP